MEDKTLLYWLAGLLVVSLLMTGFVLMNIGDEQEVAVTVNNDALNAKLDALATGQATLDSRIAGLETPFVVPVEGEDPVVSGDYIRNQREYEEDLSDAEALRLAEESVNLDDRDFSRALFEALEDFGIDVEDRHDITEIKYETDVDGDEVEFDKFRVWYFLDGDEDEVEKAKLDDFTVTVDDLEFDDDFEDAEVNEDYMDDLLVLKFYD